MRYVDCPKCGDPVVVVFELTKEPTCKHCKEIFPLDESLVRTGVVIYDQNTGRWKVGKTTAIYTSQDLRFRLK